MDVSIIIVNYNTKELTRNCLKSIYENTKDIDFEVIVSDNGSTDGSIEMIKSEFSQVILLENNENLGFGKANNRGLKIANGKYIFYLNSDTVLLNNAVKMFFDYWENAENKDEIGALGAILLDESMNTTHSGSSFPDYRFVCKRQLTVMKMHFLKSIVRLFNLEKFIQKFRNKSISVFVKEGETDGDIIGADLFLKNNEYAYFDERYFMYMEETDLQLKFKENGLKRIIINGPKIQHLIHKNNEKMRIAPFGEICCQNSAIKYSQKNFKTKALFLRFLVFVDRLNPFLWKTVEIVKKFDSKECK